ncbi:hypothetical protein BU24DRAFT_465791 [Aaosphaeria arxii CBS 175.79]|uniref:Uncharacterized protein n=1 Tax=Aaosphaeria arxii CBS 175.79 TaxID=1450172 RepID=A0A6A5XGM0_9PLEO|nr:uncharacterized protein BU24DRAFT_465791 [Aaosphaeria arxii CBS 175.79]KAF2012232.1 hypothetical protein BU24DRAFT_465791 [Aaosphaeria arxii CBS 175.79]
MSSHNTKSVESDLASLKLGRDTIGRIRERESTEFHTYTFPEFHKNSRVVAVCGVMNLDDADPEADGWLLSDFYLFNILLRGLGSKQTWLTTLQPSILVSKYKEYLHGNPYKDRRVVLNQDILDQNRLTPVQLLSPDTAVNDCVEILRREAAEAKRKREPLLVLLFGHGHQTTKAIIFGSISKEEVWAEVPLRAEKALYMSQVQSVISEGLQWTMLSKSCYSAAWTANVNSTALTAASHLLESESWPESGSMRYSGSVWMTKLLKALKDEMKEPAEQELQSQSQGHYVILNKAFSKFVEECHSVLATRVDRLADTHNLSFSTQDDEWSTSWGERTGIPLANFEERFLALPIRPTSMDTKSGINRDPANSLNEDLPTRLLGQSMRGRFGSARAARRHVINLAVEYINSCPGRSSMAGNQRITSSFLRVYQNVGTSWDHMASTLAQLEYRLSCTRVATAYLTVCNIPFPQGLACDKWDKQVHINNIPDGGHSHIYEHALELLTDARIMPEPLEVHGHRFIKAQQYIAVALLEQYELDRQNSLKIVEASVAKLVSVKDKVIGELVDFVLRSETLKSSRREWASSLRKRLRSLSPHKANRNSGYSSGLVSPSKKQRASLDDPSELSPRLPRSLSRRDDSSAGMSDVAKGKRKA